MKSNIKLLTTEKSEPNRTKRYKITNFVIDVIEVLTESKNPSNLISFMQGKSWWVLNRYYQISYHLNHAIPFQNA